MPSVCVGARRGCKLATISRETALRIVESGGAVDGDPPAYAVFAYLSAYGEQHAVVWSEQDFMRYVRETHIVSILWSPHVTLSRLEDMRDG